MNKVYPERINFENEPSVATPLSAGNLNKIDYATYEMDNRIIALDANKANQSDLLLGIKEVAYNPTTGVWTFTHQNGTTDTFDQNIEKIPVTFSMDENGVITMTTADGTTYTCDVGTLIKTYTFVNSGNIQFTVTTDAQGNKSVTASVIDGSITRAKLDPDYLAQIDLDVASASASATAASGSATTSSNKALDSEAYAIGTRGGVPVTSGDPAYENNSKYYAEHGASSLAGLTDVNISGVTNGQVIKYNSTTQKWENDDESGGGGTGGHVIQNESGTDMTARTNLQFKGADVSDDNTNDRTVVDMSYTEIDYEDWLELTEQEKETGRWDVTGVPGADGTVSVELMTKLWENPDPTVAFAANAEINLLSSDYDYLIFVYYLSNTYNGTASAICEKGSNTVLTLALSASNSAQNWTRFITRESDVKYIAAACTASYYGSVTTNNDRIIPYQVYGIKTSQTVEIKAIAPEVSTSASKCMMSDGETSVEEAISEIDNNITIVVEETVSSIAVSTAWGGIYASSAIQIDISSLGFQNYPTVLSCVFEPATENIAWIIISSISTTTIRVQLLRGSSGTVSGKIVLQLKKEI